jgi:formylglycine-generating enzyme required for sulfatase activity
MRLLFAIIGLLGFSISATADNEWLYYKEYPWVYDAKSEDWLYLRGAADGSIYAYRNSTKEWEEFTAPKDDDVIPVPTWKEQYNEWVQNPEPYGGLSVLQKIKEAKDSGATELDLWSNNISDITPLAGLTNLQWLDLWSNNISDLSPLAGLTNLTRLGLSNNNISDLTPLAGLTNLEWVYLVDNPITASQKAMLEAALPNTRITWPHPIIDDSEPAEKPSSTHTAQLNNGVNLEMIWVDPGTFTMGSPTTEEGRFNDEIQHEVTLTKGFYLGKYEVTQAQYEAVMNGNDDGPSPTPSYFNGYPDRPVEQVSWNHVQVFLERLNEQAADNIPAGWAYVLPTEAQWEYACRAGTTTAYSWGDAITTDDANYDYNIGQTAEVGQYSANPWGFFDMHGNVWEWTADWYAAYSSGAQTDPEAATGAYRVLRGGSWSNAGTFLRSAYRNFYISPSGRSDGIGFRVGFKQK